MSVNRVFDQEAAVKLANEEGMFLSIVDGQRLANLLNRAFEQGKELSSEFDVRTIILEVAPGNGDGVEVYAKSVEDVEKKLASLDDELEQWQVGIRRLPPPKAAQTKPVAFKLLRKNLQGEWVSDNDHWTDGAPSEELNETLRTPRTGKSSMRSTTQTESLSSLRSFKRPNNRFSSIVSELMRLTSGKARCATPKEPWFATSLPMATRLHLRLPETATTRNRIRFAIKPQVDKITIKVYY